MFIKDNSIASVEKYFQEKLDSTFNAREIKIIFKALLAKRLGLDENEFLINKKQTVSESDLLFFREAIKRLKQDEPLEHIVGYTYFYDLQILCSPAALIPRPETEELVDWILSDFKEHTTINVLDICSGSGCIALALKNKQLNWIISGLDISASAVDLSKKNAENLELDVPFIAADALALSLQKDAYSCIVSNPPYIPQKDKSLMHKNVLLYEPSLALFVEDSDPLIFYREIAKQAFSALKTNGALYFEIHEEYALATRELLLSLGYFSVEIKKDLQGKERMLKAIKFI